MASSSSSASPFAHLGGSLGGPVPAAAGAGAAAGPSTQPLEGTAQWPTSTKTSGGAQLPALPSALPPRPSSSSSSSASEGILSTLTSPFARAYDVFARARANLDLPHPGLPERISHEATQTFATNHFFDGVRFDLSKGASINPMFHVSHNFHLGGSQAPQGSYSFSTMYGTDDVFATANVDETGAVQARMNRRWNKIQTSKMQLSLSKGAMNNMFQFEHVLTGRDNALSLKSINANPADGSGMFLASFLQSLTPSLALGLEAVYARQPGMTEEVNSSYMLRYAGAPNPALGERPEWIASANVNPQGMLQASYWQKLSDKVDAAAELVVVNAGNRREADAKVAAKWDFRLASLRAQLDSSGRLTSVYEARLFPSFSMTFAAELDHPASKAKFGFGVSIETPLGGEDPSAPQPAMPSPPFF